MVNPNEIRDPVFRAALEDADRLLDAGDYSAVSRKCAETYLLLLERHPELLPEPPTGQGGGGTGSYTSYLRSPRPSWPRTGGINLTTDEAGKPRMTYDKKRFSFAEAAGYYEFLINEIARLQD